MMSRSLSKQWIIGPYSDLFFFILSPVFTILLYLLYLALLNYFPALSSQNYSAGLIVFILFSSFFDQPHLLQTFTRTHLDKNEFKRRPFLYTYGLVLILCSGFLIEKLSIDPYMEVFFDYFGLWHILRQNTGLLKVYHRRAEDSSKNSLQISHATLYSSYIAFLIVQWQKLPDTAPFSQSSFSIPPLIANYGLGVFFSFLAVFLGYEGYQMIVHRKFHIQKILFLLSMVSIQYFVYVYINVPFMVSIALETIYHDVQYIGWINFYQKGAFQKDKNFRTRWNLISWGYGLLVGVIGILVIKFEAPVAYLSPFLMLVLFHYYIDGKIWRSSRCPELREYAFNRDRKPGEAAT